MTAPASRSLSRSAWLRQKNENEIVADEVESDEAGQPEAVEEKTDIKGGRLIVKTVDPETSISYMTSKCMCPRNVNLSFLVSL